MTELHESSPIRCSSVVTAPTVGQMDSRDRLLWEEAAAELSELWRCLQAAVEAMISDYFSLLRNLPSCRAGEHHLADRLLNFSSYLAHEATLRLRNYEEHDIVAEIGHLHNSDCPAYIKVTVRRWDARIRRLLEDACLVQEDVKFLIGGAASSDSAALDDYELQRRILVLKDQLHLADSDAAAQIDDWTVQVSRQFLNELIQRTELLEAENSRLRSNKSKLMLVLNRAKEQRHQLKDLASRLKLEREEATKELTRMTRQLDHRGDGVSEESNDNLTTSTKVQEPTEICQPPPQLKDRKGKVQIFVRICPDAGNFLEVVNKYQMILHTHHLRGFSSKFGHLDGKQFFFDRVFNSSSCNSEIFNDMQGVVNSCCQGVNICIMAYGQTGSGKTFTMLGNRDDPGVNRLAIASVLLHCRSRDNWSFQFALSAVEIYNEEIFDLMQQKQRRPTATAAHKVPASNLRILTDSRGATIIQGLTEVAVATEDEVNSCIARSDAARNCCATNLNDNSSRGHVIVVLKLMGRGPDGESVHSSLTLCDLAGSENVCKSGVRGSGLREASAINRSLLSLGKIFEDLRKRKRPCFRESKLTRLLSPHLTGKSKCLVILTVRQSPSCIEETLRSLAFGHSAMQTEPCSFTQNDTNLASSNVT